MLSSRKTFWGLLALSLLAVSAPRVSADPDTKPGRAPLAADKLIPADAQGVVVFNWRQMLESPLVKKRGMEEMKKALEKNEPARKALETIGLNPFRDIDSMMIALSQAGRGDGKMLIVVRGNFDLEKIEKTADEEAKKKPDELKISKEDGVRLYEGKVQGKTTYAAFADSTTLIVTHSKEYTLASVRKANATPTGPSAEMKEALAKTNTRDGIWFAVVATAQLKRVLAGNPQTRDVADSLESITGGVSVGDNVKLTVKINCNDADAAVSVRRKLDTVKPILALLAQNDENAGPIIGEILNSLKISTEKNSAKLTLEVTQEMIEKAQELEKKNK